MRKGVLKSALSRQAGTHAQPSPEILHSPVNFQTGFHRVIGNAVLSRINSGQQQVQTKLKVGEPGDQYEREADYVADRIMRMPASPHSVEGLRNADVKIQRKCAACEQEEEPIQRKAEPSSTNSTAAVNSVGGIGLSGGSPLGSAERSFFEPRFGRDFSQVRVHTGADADRATRNVGALAFAVGNDVVFRQGYYSPHTNSGRHLLAHELTHTIQQGDAGSVSLQRYGANPGCTVDQAAIIHTAVDTAAGWLDEAIRLLGESPLAATTRLVLRRNFGPIDGVESNAAAIRATLVAVRALIDTIELSCAAGPADVICAAGHCGWTSAAGAGAATICSDNTLGADSNPHFTAGCVLHETVHASDPGMTAEHDFYSGWRGISSNTEDYPGTAPLQNADAYTTLVMDLSISSRLALPLRFGLSGGAALFPGAVPGAEPGWYTRFYFGTEFQHPVLGLFNPMLGVGVSLIGESTTGGASPVSSPTSALVSLLPGLRFGGQSGGLSLFGGPALAVNENEADLGAEAGISLGYRWRWLDVSLDAGYAYDPTREAGMDDVLMLGGRITFIPFEFAP